MLELRAGFRTEQLRVLCLGAHSDDIEIGCGGTILRLLQSHPDVTVWWIVLSAQNERGIEAHQSANLFLKGAARKEIVAREFRDGFFPYNCGEVKDYFEELKRISSPDLIFTHFRNDLHQDHRLVSELTWNTFRNSCILEYEIMKYDGDLGNPNLFVHLDRAICEQKVRCIRDCFKTQASRSWFSEETFFAMLRLRGVESNAPDGYAEAFYARKISLVFNTPVWSAAGLEMG
jgi:LmbE family N-acetylglucosaminyl deacetylase